MMTAAFPGGAHPRPPSGDEEPTSNTTAEYQEWHICGFFKLITIGGKVYYGIDYSLEVQQLYTLARSALIISEPNDPRRPQHVAEVTDGKQEWEICNIISKEVVDGEIHYLVE
jgi:hypothetical protein